MGDNYYKRVILDSGGTGIVEDDGLYKTTYNTKKKTSSSRLHILTSSIIR